MAPIDPFTSYLVYQSLYGAHGKLNIKSSRDETAQEWFSIGV